MFVPQYPFPVVGGLEKQSHELSMKLVELGHNVTVLSGTVKNNKKNEIIKGVTIFRFNWYKLKAIRFIVSPFYISFFFFKNRKKYDILHVHQHSWIGLFVILLGSVFRIPVLTKLPSWGELGVDSIVDSFLGNIKKKILFSSKGIVVITEQSVNELKKYQYATEKIFFCPNGINLISNKKNRQNNDILKIIFVGRLIEIKQIDKLILQWDEIKNLTTKNIELIICGEGPEYTNLKLLQQKISNKDSIKFLGHTANIHEQLLNSDIFVLPSRVEGNSNAILEAMMCGLPIVSTLTGGTPFMVGEIGRQFLSNIEDFEKIKNDILILVENKKLRIEIGEIMRKIIENNFSMEIVAKKYVNIYEKLLIKNN